MAPFELLKKVVAVFEELHIPYLITGSMASFMYGEPRFTNDADLVADIKEENVRSLSRHFPSEEYYFDKAMVLGAIRHQNQFNIIHPASGFKIDVVIKKASEFDNARFARIQRLSPEESWQANYASPEDVIIKKMEYYKMGESEKHLRDITGILKISGDTVNHTYIQQWAAKLGLTEIWEAILKRLNQS